MAEEHETEARERKAYARVMKAIRTLAKEKGVTELTDAVGSAGHQDPQIRTMRRTEALADLLEALVDEEKEQPKPAAKDKK